MRSRFPHGGEVLGAAPANPILAPVLSKDLSLSISRQRDLLDLQAIQRIPGLVGYWKSDPAYLYEDSAGTTPASTNGTGPVGHWKPVGIQTTLGPELVTDPGFDNAAAWATKTNFVVANSVLTIDDATPYQSFAQLATVSLGLNWYEIVIVIDSVTSGSFKTQHSNGTTTTYSSILMNAAGTYRFYHYTQNNTTIGIRTESLGFVGVISSISMRLVSGIPAAQPTTANKPILRKTPTTGVYWADANTSTSALNVALSDTVLGRRNLLQYSEQLEAGWTKTRVSIGVDSTTTWDGVQIADKVIEDTSSAANHYLTINSLVVGATTTINLEVKSAERSVIEIKAGSSTTTALWFDATNNTFSTIGGAITAYSSSALGSGWYRIKFTCVPPSSTALTISLINGSSNYTGDGTSGIYITRIQAELGSVATDYQKITNVPAYCTLARATAEGVTFTENVSITSTYNIAPAFSFNADVALFNRALTATEKALITRYMQRSVPMLGSNLVTNGTFDTDLTGWTKVGPDIMEWADTGKLRIIRTTTSTHGYQGITLANGDVVLFAATGVVIAGVPLPKRQIATALGSGELLTIPSGSNSVVHTATATRFILLICANGAGTVEFDDVSMRKIL